MGRGAAAAGIAAGLDHHRVAEMLAEPPPATVTASVGVTRALPPPCRTSRSACGPTTATVAIPPGSGSTGTQSTTSLRRSTAAAAGPRHERRPARPAPRPDHGSGRVAGRPPSVRRGASDAPAWRRSCRRSTSPDSMAAASALPHWNAGPGISRSRPALAAGAAWLRVANRLGDHHTVPTPLLTQDRGEQPRVLSSSACRAARLYAAMVDQAPARRSACSNGRREHLAQRALVGLGRDLEAVGLGVVGDEVLDARRHAPAPAGPST